MRKTVAPCSLVPRSVSCEEVCRSLRSAAVHRGYFVRSWCSGSSSVIAFVFELGRTASKKAPLQTTSGAHDEWFQTRLQKRCSRRVVCAFGRGSGGGPGGLGAPFGRLRGRLGPFLAALEPIFAVLARPWASLGRSWVALGRSWAALGLLLGRSWAALGVLLTAFDDPSWPKLSSKMPSDTLLGRKDEYAKSIGKRKEKHTFLIRRWVRILASKPLRPILERSCASWRELGVSGGGLGAS